MIECKHAPAEIGTECRKCGRDLTREEWNALLRCQCGAYSLEPGTVVRGMHEHHDPEFCGDPVHVIEHWKKACAAHKALGETAVRTSGNLQRAMDQIEELKKERAALRDFCLDVTMGGFAPEVLTKKAQRLLDAGRKTTV